jgi:hypothetical protein
MAALPGWIAVGFPLSISLLGLALLLNIIACTLEHEQKGNR